MGYTPYKMAADNNDPMTKNYGAVAPGKMRAFGTNTLEGPNKTDTNPGSGLNYAGGVGSSPAKGFFSNIGKAIGKVGKSIKKGVGGALGGALGGVLGLNKAKGASGGDGGEEIKAMDDRISALEEGSGNAEPMVTGVGGNPADTMMGGMGGMAQKAMGMGGPAMDFMKARNKKKNLGEGWGGTGDSVDSAYPGIGGV